MRFIVYLSILQIGRLSFSLACSNEMGKDVHASNADLANAFYAEFVLQKSSKSLPVNARPSYVYLNSN